MQDDDDDNSDNALQTDVEIDGQAENQSGGIAPLQKVFFRCAWDECEARFGDEKSFLKHLQNHVTELEYPLLLTILPF